MTSTSSPSYKSWITQRKVNSQSRLRLFCFPYAGSGASVFRTWGNDLPVEIEVCPIQLPGREDRLREAPFSQLVPLVETLTQVLSPFLDLPFAFFGHSMGAMISFELARHLHALHSSGPALLFVSGCRAPQLAYSGQPLHQLPGAEFMKELRCLNGTPEAVLQNTELMKLLEPILRADFATLETYTYSPGNPLLCPIVAFGGTQDRRVKREHLAAWREQTKVSFKLHMLPGDHFFLNSARIQLLQTIQRELMLFI